MDPKKYKYINCFVLVIRLDVRLQIKPSLDLIVSIFGMNVMKSLLIIINMTPQAQKINNLDNLKKTVPEF